MDKTSLGDRMKAYEKAYARKAMPLLPVIARLDGKAFHTWCKDLDKPFDEDFMRIMQETTKELMHLSNPVIGYTQSDEITLIFYSPDPESQIFFDGKIEKMTSVLASMCTAAFKLSLDRHIQKFWSTAKGKLLFSKPPALFDCRVFQVPTLEEAANCLIWRELDATRNSILSVAQSKFSHKEMQNKNTSELQEMMFQKDGTNWGEDFTPPQKRGSYYKQVISKRRFTTEEINKLPPKHEARTNPKLEVERTEIKRMVFKPLTKMNERVFNLFKNEVY